MFSLFQNKKKENTIIILDIGSASIGSAVVLIKDGKMPTVLYSIRERIEIKSDVDFSRFISLMLSTLESVLVKMSKEYEVSSKNIFCILSSPWYTASTHFINIKREEQFVVTHKIIDDCVDKELSAMSSNIKEEKNIVEGVLKVIDVKNIQVKLNGYETDQPYNKKAESVEIALFASMGSEKIIKIIEDKVLKAFHYTPKFSSFSLASFVAIRDIFNESNFLFIDVTGEVTDISMIKNNVLLKNSAFTIGENFLIRRIASGFNTTVDEAESLLLMFNNGDSDNETKNKLIKIFEDTKGKWIEGAVEVLQSFSDDSSIPNSVFITVNSKVQKWFSDAMSGDSFEKFTLTNDKLEVKILNNKLISKFCLSGNKNILKDPFLMLEAIFIERIMHSK